MKRFFVKTYVSGGGYNPYAYAWFEVGLYLIDHMALCREILVSSARKGHSIEEIKFKNPLALFFFEGQPEPSYGETNVNARDLKEYEPSSSMVIDEEGAWWELVDKHTGITVMTERILWEIFQ